MIKLVRLVTGEEVIGDCREENLTSKDISLKNPVRIFVTQQGLAMAPYAPFIKGDTIYIKETNVIYTSEADDDLANEYRSKFGSGIIAAPAGIKI